MTEIEQKAKGLDSQRVQILIVIATQFGVDPDRVIANDGTLKCIWNHLSVQVRQDSQAVFVSFSEKEIMKNFRVIIDASDTPHDVYRRMETIPEFKTMRLVLNSKSERRK